MSPDFNLFGKLLFCKAEQYFNIFVGILSDTPIVRVPPLFKVAIEFLKLGNKGENEIFFLEREWLD